MTDDSVDATPTSKEDAFRFFKSSKNKGDKYDAVVKREPSVQELTEIDIDSDYYSMGHYKRGTAIIFNHYTFDDYNLNRRDGTMKDAKDLEAALRNLRFDVKVYKDLKYGAIYDVLSEVAAANHSDSDSLVIAVLSHGDSGRVHARDHAYPVDTLWKQFAGDECTTLAGKPKIFLIQACRGEEVDDGVAVRSPVESDSVPNTYKIPAMADFLIMYSTYDGYYSWRSPITGSWFIQSLCQELKDHAKNRDLQTILTFVNRRMATRYQSNVPGNQSMHDKKQIGTMVSTLTRLIHFNPPHK